MALSVFRCSVPISDLSGPVWSHYGNLGDLLDFIMSARRSVRGPGKLHRAMRLPLSATRRPSRGRDSVMETKLLGDLPVFEVAA